jgi:hypothetical protein
MRDNARFNEPNRLFYDLEGGPLAMARAAELASKARIA